MVAKHKYRIVIEHTPTIDGVKDRIWVQAFTTYYPWYWFGFKSKTDWIDELDVGGGMNGNMYWCKIFKTIEEAKEYIDREIKLAVFDLKPYYDHIDYPPVDQLQVDDNLLATFPIIRRAVMKSGIKL